MIIERIRLIIEYKELAVSKFETLIGAGEGTIRSALKKNNEINSKWIPIISDKFPEISLRWLINGKGDMFNEGENPYKNPFHYLNEEVSATEVYPSKTDNLVDSQKIPLYQTEAIAGIVPVFDDFSNAEPLDYLQIPHAPKCDGAIYASGDSMYPIIKSGDILGYKQILDLKNDIFWGQMYILYIEVAGDTMLTVKYIQKGKDEAHVKLVSENRHHEPKEIHLDKIKAIAQVKITVRIN